LALFFPAMSGAVPPAGSKTPIEGVWSGVNAYDALAPRPTEPISP